jgi:F0F1-type ATP synthase assembly protein I
LGFIEGRFLKLLMIGMDRYSEKNQKSWWQPGLILFFRLSSWIGFPVILALFLGSWLDEKFNSKPWIFISVTLLAFFLSIYGIIIEGRREMKKIKKDKKEIINKDKK